jgi:hypothetical protein
MHDASRECSRHTELFPDESSHHLLDPLLPYNRISCLVDSLIVQEIYTLECRRYGRLLGQKSL